MLLQWQLESKSKHPSGTRKKFYHLYDQALEVTDHHCHLSQMLIDSRGRNIDPTAQSHTIKQHNMVAKFGNIVNHNLFKL